MRKTKGILTALLAISLFTMIFTFVSPKCLANTRPRILLIRPYYTDRDTYKYFLTGVSAYGDVVEVEIGTASKYSLDYLRGFDLFATPDHVSTPWSDCVSFIGIIGALVEEGKSLIVVRAYSSNYYSSPADAWVSCQFFSTPDERVNFQIVPSYLTQGVRELKGRSNLFLYGGYPLVLSPNKLGYPAPQGALAVYGYYGKGKYVVLCTSLFSLDGDVGTLFSNIMYWLTDRKMPPPPTVEELDQRIAEMNNTLNLYKERISMLNSSLTLLNLQIPNIKELQIQIAQLNNALNQMNQQMQTFANQISDLNNKLVQTQAQQQTNTLLTYAALAMGLIAITIATILKRK